MSEPSESKTINQTKVRYLERFNELHKEGKLPREIAEECGVSDSTVRKYIRESTGKPTRAYKRSVLSCATGQPFISKESTKITALKSELKIAKAEIKENEKKYKKIDNELTKIKSENRDLARKNKDLTQKSTINEEEMQKIIKDYSKLKADVQKIKIHGYETKTLSTTVKNRMLDEFEEKGYYLTHTDHKSDLIPCSQFRIK